MRIEDNKQLRSQRAMRWILLALAIVAIAVAASLLLQPSDRMVGTANALAEPEYPRMTPYPLEEDYMDDAGQLDSDAYFQAYDLWWADQQYRWEQEPNYADGLQSFWASTMQTFLADSQANVIYSPLNVYLAMAMLAEVTDGTSRQQLLDVLGAADLESLRTQVGALWNANYCDDGVTASILASSLWLDADITYHQQTLDQLAQSYYAASYQGQMGSEAMDRQLQTWLNDQTGGLLEEQVSDVGLDPETVLALATTIYFKAAWADKFWTENTAPGSFCTADGEVQVDFMHQSDSRNYYWGEQFSAVGQSLNGSGSMWFILPDEGVSPAQLLQDAEALAFAAEPTQWQNVQSMQVNLAVPKFDISSSLDLAQGMQALGITEVFDESSSDFTPLCDLQNLCLSAAKHNARVTIDEEGCTAAAFTLMAVEATSMEPEMEEIDFVVDRPFLFVITNLDGLPLFVGVVNQIK